MHNFQYFYFFKHPQGLCCAVPAYEAVKFILGSVYI